MGVVGKLKVPKGELNNLRKNYNSTWHKQKESCQDTWNLGMTNCCSTTHCGQLKVCGRMLDLGGYGLSWVWRETCLVGLVLLLSTKAGSWEEMLKGKLNEWGHTGTWKILHISQHLEILTLFSVLWQLLHFSPKSYTVSCWQTLTWNHIGKSILGSLIPSVSTLTQVQFSTWLNI